MGRPLKDVGNEGDANKVGAFNQASRIGSALKLGAMTTVVTVENDTVNLPPSAKALAVFDGYARAGTYTGELVPAADPSAPTSGEIGIGIAGNLTFAAADDLTEVEVVYAPVEGDIVDATGVVASAGAVLSQKARIILSCTVDGATMAVIARGGTPAAGQVCVSDTGDLSFNAAQNGGSIAVSYVGMPSATVIERLTTEVEF